MNSTEQKEKRKNKILESNNINIVNKQTSNIKLSKDQIIKISSEPIQKYYNVISDLGNGSYGMVKKVKHKHMGEERAMKIVRKKLDSHNEIEILKKISHPNIISIYEIFEDSKNYYIMTELLEGGELFEEITRHGYFTEFEAANVIKQLLNGVVYMHNKLIIHRDLKPENIMLISKNDSSLGKNSRFEIKIIDFGTAKIFEKGEKLSKFIGTSYYIAPEVLSENYDEKCDVWSCGVILYILLCGYPPFNGATNLDIYHAIKYSPPNFSGDEWKEVSSEAIDLIKIMLNKPPNKRFSAEQCLQHKWFELNEEIEISFNEKDINNKDKIRKPQTKQLKALNRMSDFVMENRLKQSVLQFISTQFNLKEEEKSLRKLFQQFDTEKKGYITYGSFYTVLTKYFGENESKLISDKMFESLDLDGSGEISYNEFITAIIDNKTMVTNERLEKTFKMFDKVD
jgi:calcium-dependent protein kinase